MLLSVPPERTHWRDEELSLRHRQWGFNCPIADLDFLVVEYDQCIVMAIIEYKHQRAAPQTRSKPGYRAVLNLAERACLPFFSVRYSGAPDFEWFVVTGLNRLATNYFFKNPEHMNEMQYVEFLLRIRGRNHP